jgi:predicted porin
LIAQYSTDQQTQAAHDPDINGNSSFSVGGIYKYDIFSFGAAFERDRDDLAVGNDGDTTWGVRVAAAVNLKPVKISTIYEHIDPKDGTQVDARGRPTSAFGTLDRDAFGGSILYALTDQLSLGTQILHATKAGGTRNTAATMYSLGAWYDINKWASVYLIGAMTSNQSNARYAIADGGHGDRISTDFGKDPRAVSLGLVFSF